MRESRTYGSVRGRSAMSVPTATVAVLLAMTKFCMSKTRFNDLAARKRPRCWVNGAHRKAEGAGNAGCALHPRPRVQQKAHALATTGTPHQPAFPAQWF